MCAVRTDSVLFRKYEDHLIELNKFIGYLPDVEKARDSVLLLQIHYSIDENSHVKCIP